MLMAIDTHDTGPRTAAEIEAAVEGVAEERDSFDAKEPMRFLSRTGVAEYLGLAGLHSLTGVQLPDPDVIVGLDMVDISPSDRVGWTPATIDEWQANRPGRGRWGPRTEKTKNN